MKYKKHQQAVKLRKNGFSIKEITKALDVSQSTISLWVRDVLLNSRAKLRLRRRITAGQLAGAEARKKRTDILNQKIRLSSREFISSTHLSPGAKRILCAFLYWCEGVKAYKSGIAFTNSDPQLTRLFIDLTVSQFGADRNKFMCRLHLHGYHREKIQIPYWSKALAIPVKNFQKTYWKPNTGKRIRYSYPGCISVRYYDSILARNVMYIAQAYMHKHMGA